jgi:hypothetical protein
VPPDESSSPFQVDRVGRRYRLARGPDSYVIWDGDDEASPVATFPRGDEGWREAGLAFNSLESPLLVREEPAVAELVAPRRSWLFKAVVGIGAVVVAGSIFLIVTDKRPPHGVIFHDDFSTAAGGWPIYPWPRGTADYFQGTYRVRFSDQGGFFSPRYPFNVGVPAITLTVDSIVRSGPTGEQGFTGIACLIANNDGYVMSLKPDEIGVVNVYFQRLIGLRVIDIWRAKVDNAVGGGATNHVQASCQRYSNGSFALNISVNGETRSTLADPLPVNTSPGFIGVALYAGADGPGVEVTFDNATLEVPDTKS